MAGDLNVDFSRNNAHDNYLKCLLERQDSVLCWDLQVVSDKKDYTFSNNFTKSFSQIDHFCFDYDLVHCVKSVSVYDSEVTPPGHRPVVSVIKSRPGYIKVKSRTTSQSRRILWHKATEDDIERYKCRLNSLLQQQTCYGVSVCHNLQCVDETHLSEIDEWCNDLVDICLEASKCLPSKKLNPKSSKNMPGWSEFVKPHRQESLFWFNLWREAGKPRHGILFDNMMESKKQYHYAVRRCKRREKALRYRKMAEAISDHRSRDFFKEVKRINSSSACKTISINNETDPEKIASIFCDKYAKLFSSVPSDAQRLVDIDDIISQKLTGMDHFEAIITGDTISEAVRKLKEGKSDGNLGLISNHLTHASDLFFNKFAQMATAILVHGHQPNNVLLSTITSIPKDSRGDLCSDANYRGIALSSCLGKVLDLVLLARNSDKLSTCNLQLRSKVN